MLNMKIGCKITTGNQLAEGYESEGYSFTANVNVDKIESVLQHFICMHDEPLFLILELPANLDDENQVRPGVVETLHKDIYYIDGCSQEEALAFLDREGKLLINDGISTFGFVVNKFGTDFCLSAHPAAYKSIIKRKICTFRTGKKVVKYFI